MEYIFYIIAFLHRIRWWLIGGTICITFTAIFMTKRVSKNYTCECTVYTGIISGYSIENNKEENKDNNYIQNEIDNLTSIITSKVTLQKVSLRLYARCLINGNPYKDNNYITAENYRKIYNHVKNSPQGKLILSLVDKKSEDRTVDNFNRFYKQDKNNYLYGLFYYSPPYFSYNDLQNIKVEREASSDLLNITYENSDPGIAYNTLLILIKEFVKEYQSIRYGNTDDVINYFKHQLELIGDDLHTQEDDLTAYNISKRVINYTDETKEIAAINKEFLLRDQDAILKYHNAQAALHELDKQIDNNTKQNLANIEFINKLKQVSDIQLKISESEAINNNANLQSYRNKLVDAKNDLSKITDKYIAHKYTKEGIARENIVDDWLVELIEYEKAKADLKVMNKARNELNNRYVFFAPVGSTIKRKERNINFVEQNYLSILKAYNDALLRKKSLEMTSATLKILNSPTYPLTSTQGERKKIITIAFIGSFLFILGFFLLIEIMDQTLRDTLRARRLTKTQILGSYPTKSIFKFRNYNSICETMATKYMSSSILRFFNTKIEGFPYIVNLLSTEKGTGKSYLAQRLKEYWKSLGLNIRVLSFEKDFNTESQSFILAKSIKDIYTPANEDILIIEYKNLKDNGIPTPLVQVANINLLIARADHGWKNTDKITLQRFKEQCKETPLYIYLNQALRSEVQNYTGMLPPYTYTRRLLYKYSQFALTEKLNNEKIILEKTENEDDE